MTKTLDERWGRYDVDFPNDDKFLALPEREELRSKAYLLLLAMSGWSVLNKTDGDIPMAIFQDLSRRLWPSTPAGLLSEALLERRAKVMRRTPRGFQLRKQAKWQQTNAEIMSAIEAGRRGASKRWGDHGGPDSPPYSEIGDPMGTLKQIEIKKEKEIKKEITNEAATPSPSGALLVLESEVSLSEPEQLCEALVRALAQWGAKGEATARWVVEAERLLRIDQRPLDEALEVLAWATHDDFWRPNIRSLAKFRAKYDTLRGQMQRATSVLPPTKRTLPESYRERAALLEEAGD